jgi:hypothetical protein
MARSIKRDNALEQLKVVSDQAHWLWHYTDLRRLLTKVPELTERGKAGRAGSRQFADAVSAQRRIQSGRQSA